MDDNNKEPQSNNYIFSVVPIYDKGNLENSKKGTREFT